MGAVSVAHAFLSNVLGGEGGEAAFVLMPFADDPLILRPELESAP